MRRIFLSAWLALGMMSSAYAEPSFESGNALYELCISSGGTPGNPSVAADLYAIGVADTYALMVEAYDLKKMLCVPRSVTIAQVGATACIFLDRHPETRQHSASSNVLNSFAAAFPCPK